MLLLYTVALKVLILLRVLSSRAQELAYIKLVAFKAVAICQAKSKGYVLVVCQIGYTLNASITSVIVIEKNCYTVEQSAVDQVNY